MRRYGFNMLWMFISYGQKPGRPDLKQLDFIAKKGFNYIRVPMDYRFWTTDFNYFNPDEKIINNIDKYLSECKQRGLHMTLNMHRAPGYCINNNSLEKHNLWKDKEAQDAFVFLWEYFARKYKGVSSEELSFDLLNEPPDVGEYGFTRKRHERVMRRAINAIQKIDPDRQLILNGICGGGEAIPELADTGAIHSGRGYEPFSISHYKAGWVNMGDGYVWKEPEYPGLYYGDMWDKTALREYYKPWREVEKNGVTVHIGEFGCYNKTPNDVALRWFTDLLDVYRENKWGYALWNFKGDFGIVGHGRPGTAYEQIDGFKTDRRLLELLLENMVG